MSLSDRSLHFGIGNFFYLETDTSEETYDYYGYQDKKGAILISRFNKDETKARYCIKTGVFATIWAAKGTYSYTVVSDLVDPNI